MVLKTSFSLHKDTLKLVEKEKGIYDLRFSFDYKKPCEVSVYLACKIKVIDSNEN